VIHLPAAAARGAALRLVESLERRGFARAEGPGAGARPAAIVCAEGLAPAALERLAAEWRRAGEVRLLVLSRIGAHPDARAPGLRALWELEERARGTGLPALTLRLAPLVGPQSPLWLKLAGGPRLPHGGGWLTNPVCEEDALETLARALAAPGVREGWYEVAGSEVLSLAELATLAVEWGRRSPGFAGARGAWEPPLEELGEHRLCEPGPWLERFGLEIGPLAGRACGWEPAPRGVAGGGPARAPAGSLAG